MTPVYVITIPEMSDPQLSPDARHVLFLSGGNESVEPYFNSKLFLLSVD
jgi:hypothetical protein